MYTIGSHRWDFAGFARAFAAVRRRPTGIGTTHVFTDPASLWDRFAHSNPTMSRDDLVAVGAAAAEIIGTDDERDAFWDHLSDVWC